MRVRNQHSGEVGVDALVTHLSVAPSALPFERDGGIDVDALTAGGVVLVESEGSETKFQTVGDTRKTLGRGIITGDTTGAGLRNVPIEQSTECRGREQLSLVQHERPLASRQGGRFVCSSRATARVSFHGQNLG